MVERVGPTAPIRWIDVNDAREMSRHPQLRDADLRGQMHVMDPAGQVSGGYDALVALAPILPPIAWLRGLMGSAPVRWAGRRIYRWIATNRYRIGGQPTCQGGACPLHPLTPSRG